MRELTRKAFGHPRVFMPIPRRKNLNSGQSYTFRNVYYDTYSVAVNTLVVGQVVTLFQVPLGGNKTLASTNMRDFGKIADGNTFVVRQIGIQISFNSLADAYNIAEIMTVKFKVGGALIAQGTLSLFPGGHGVVVSGSMPAAIGTLTQATGVTNGISQVDNMFAFNDQTFTIDAGQSIAMEIVAEGNGFTTATAANGGCGFTIKGLIDGYETRKAL